MAYAARIPSVALALLMPLAAPGCIFGPADNGHPELRDCSNGKSIEEAVRITEDYELSLHEMVACGNLAITMCSALVNGLVQAITDGSNDATPDGWTFDAGTYSTQSQSNGQTTNMTMQFFAGPNLSFAGEGELITEDLFLISNYFVGVQVSVDVSGTATINYQSTGPLVELLGYGATPPNPLVVGLADAGQVGSSLGAVQFEAEVVVDDMQSVSTVTYTTDTVRMSARDLLGGQPMAYDLVTANAQRSDVMQTLDVDMWTIAYTGSSGGLGVVGNGALDGSADFAVSGNYFDFYGTTTYDHSTTATTELRCNQ